MLLNGIFTQNDINSGIINYVDNGANILPAGLGHSINDTFQFTITDGVYPEASPVPDTFTITVNELNNAPVIGGKTATVQKAIGSPVIGTKFTATDEETPPVDIFRITSLPSVGTLELPAGVAVTLNTDYDRTQMNTLVYKLASVPAATSDTFGISAGDGTVFAADTFTVTITDFEYSDRTDYDPGAGFLDGPGLAKHAPTGPTLGTSRDVEPVPPTGAAFNDNASGADENGVTFEGVSLSNTVVGVIDGAPNAKTFTVNLAGNTGTARVRAWVDFDHNGTFEGEELVTNQTTGGNGPLTFVVTSSAGLRTAVATPYSGNTVMRVRVGKDGDLVGTTVGGATVDTVSTDDVASGEVEDYIVNVAEKNGTEVITALDQVQVNSLLAATDADNLKIERVGGNIVITNKDGFGINLATAYAAQRATIPMW